MKKALVLFIFNFSLISFAQSTDLLQLEANPDDKLVIDDSEYAILWRQLLTARESEDTQTYNQILNQIQQQYSDRFVGTAVSSSDQILIPIEKEPVTTGSLPSGSEWADELKIFSGKIGVSTGGNPSPNRKMIKLIADTLGNLYAACITNRYDADTLAFFKSTDKGYT